MTVHNDPDSHERVLVIAPHPDDESIGCGGTIALLTAAGAAVSVLFLTGGEGCDRSLPAEQVRATRKAEGLAAVGILGADVIAFLNLPDGGLSDVIDQAGEVVASLISGLSFDCIYLPHPDDGHADHRACLPIVAAAHAKLGRDEPWLLGYEVWTPLAEFDTVEDISSAIDKKLAAIRMHKSQLNPFRYDRAAEGLNAYRGVMAGHCEYAEVFRSLSLAEILSE